MKFTADGTEYKYPDIDKFIRDIKGKYEIHKRFDYIRQCSISYLDVASSFDTETTSIIIKKTKTGFVYLWTFGINGVCIGGRTIEEFIELLNRVREALKLDFYKRLVIYINCLNFDFQFFRKYIKIDDIFIKEERKPLYVVSDGIEFRCSYQLSNDSVDTMGENLDHYEMKKLKGFSYTLCRNHLTELTESEWKYAFHDIKVIMCYIQELLESGETIAKIPYTNTGFVKRDIRSNVLSNDKVKRRIQTNRMSDEEYRMQRRALTGGYCYGSIFYQGVIMENILSMDINSSYPTVMLSELYPVGTGKKVNIETIDEIHKASETHILLFRICLHNVCIKGDFATSPISEEKCEICENAQIDNGKVMRAYRVCLVTTNITFDLIEKFYDFEMYQIGTVYQYDIGYLPKEYFELILEYYKKKTKLKNTAYKLEYLGGKKRLNAIFGLSIQEVIKKILGYTETGEWTERKQLEMEEEMTISKYNENRYRFNMYIWGVMVAEYARRNLFYAIYELGLDFVYCDTDCVKFCNSERHMQFFETYNKMITKKLEIACDYYGLDKERLRPETVDHIKKQLGVFELDAEYKQFKFLHSKCYAGIDYEGKLHCTVAGIKKEILEDYLSQYENPLQLFEDGLEVPKEKSGKLCHTYCDEELTFEVTDYQGHTETITSKSGVHLEPIAFQIGLSNEYQYILSLLKKGRG